MVCAAGARPKAVFELKLRRLTTDVAALRRLDLAGGDELHLRASFLRFALKFSGEARRG